MNAGCQHPGHIAATAYRKGCRCDRCSTFDQLRNRSRGFYPRERVAATVTEWLNRNNVSQRDLCRTSGVAERNLYRLLNGPSNIELETSRASGQHVTLTTVDRLFCAMDVLHLFHLAPEDGGYADLYEPLEQAA